MEERYLAIYDYLQEAVYNNEMDEYTANAILEEAYTRYMGGGITVEEALDDIEDYLLEAEEDKKDEIKTEKDLSDLKACVSSMRDYMSLTKKMIKQKNKREAKKLLSKTQKELDDIEEIVKNHPGHADDTFYSTAGKILMGWFVTAGVLNGLCLLDTGNMTYGVGVVGDYAISRVIHNKQELTSIIKRAKIKLKKFESQIDSLS